MNYRAPLSLADVLDIDSPLTDKFTPDDVQYVESLAREFCLMQFAWAGQSCAILIMAR